MKRVKRDLTYERLREVLHYEPKTGIFTWRVSNSNRVKIGERAGSVLNNGYRIIVIDNKHTLEHVCVWLYVFGKFPALFIDHKNGNRADNRIENLREATRSQNNANAMRPPNAAGFKGVTPKKGRWEAGISKDNRFRYIGTFNTPEEAHAAYMKVARELHGEFANPGNGEVA